MSLIAGAINPLNLDNTSVNLEKISDIAKNSVEGSDNERNDPEQIVETGGFGLADKFYDKLAIRAKGSIAQTSATGGLNVQS